MKKEEIDAIANILKKHKEATPTGLFYDLINYFKASDSSFSKTKFIKVVWNGKQAKYKSMGAKRIANTLNENLTWQHTKDGHAYWKDVYTRLNRIAREGR